MIQAVLEGPRKFRIVERDTPRISSTDVLVKVMYCGICGSDLHAYEGLNPFVNYPLVPGHELVGEVLETGSRVKGLKPGAVVTAEPINNCGECMYCRSGLYNHCINKGSRLGGYSEYTILRQDRTYPVPANVDSLEATLVEPLAFAVHAVKLAEIRKGVRILVIGAGTIGQTIARTAKLFGATHVSISDLYQSKLDIARAHGCDVTIPVSGRTKAEDVMEIVGEHSVDIVFDCVCDIDSLQTSIRIVKRGGKILIIGVPDRNLITDIGLVMFHELKLLGCLMYNNGDFQEALGLISERRIDLSHLITRAFPLTDIVNVFPEVIAHRDRYVKCILRMDDH